MTAMATIKPTTEKTEVNGNNNKTAITKLKQQN